MQQPEIIQNINDDEMDVDTDLNIPEITLEDALKNLVLSTRKGSVDPDEARR